MTTQPAMETIVQTKRNWGVWWVIAFLGFPPGGLLAILLFGHVDTALEGLIGGAIAGAVVGTAQMLALRQRLPIDYTWIVATAAGLAVGVGLNAALLGTETTLEAILLRVPLTGLLLGLTQWWILRRHVTNAFWWIPAVTLAYVVAWYVTAQVIGISINQGFVVFGSSGALVFQILLGLVLLGLLRTNAQPTLN